MTISRDMLFTPSSSDNLPLMPTTAPLSSGCGMNGSLIIQRPPCEAGSFAWSDFPIIANDHFFPKANAYRSDDSSSSDTYMEDVSFSSQESWSSLTSTQQSQSSSTSSSSSHKRVKFAPMLEVRTHAVTLGDHPLCTVLPVELDWDHSDTQYVNLELHERERAYHTKARKLSYLERKQLLQEYVDEETLQSTIEQLPHMKRGGMSSFQLAAIQ